MTDGRDTSRSLPARIALGLARAIATVIIVFDEILRPLYRPAVAWFAALRIVHRLERAIAKLPRGLVLLAFAVPFIIAEPLKLLGLVLLARGHLVSGIAVTGLAHLFSFLVVERIYHAGRAQLLSYGWFAWGIGLLTQWRDRALRWIRASAAYAFAMQARDAARRWWRGLRA